jgi:hypothetical protein
LVTRRGAVAFLSGLAVALLAGWVAFPRALYQRVQQPLQFSHLLHTSAKAGLACQDCHALAADGRGFGIPGIETCAPCHQERQGGAPEEKKLVDEYVSRQREVPWLVYARQPQNVAFSHAQHVTLARLACDRCHGTHGRSTALRPFERNRLSGYSRDIWGRSISRLGRAEGEGMKMDDCSHCHRARGVRESCLGCHK